MIRGHAYLQVYLGYSKAGVCPGVVAGEPKRFHICKGYIVFLYYSIKEKSKDDFHLKLLIVFSVCWFRQSLFTQTNVSNTMDKI
jgi:hypothetical protein